ncbi:MAG: alpha/beta hydrolase [Rhodospirillales bacterium]|nr:alpha/beta hydrolase [Rhodospirillales bacterium]
MREVTQVKANGISFNVVAEGPNDAPPLVMSHSLATDLAMFDPLAEDLRDRFRVYRFDSRGHGDTTAAPPPYDFEMLTNDAIALFDALKLDTVHYLGLSMGGMLGQFVALAQPDRFRSLTLCCTSSRIPPEAGPLWEERIALAESRGMEALVQPTLDRWFTEPFRQKKHAVLDWVGDMIRRTPVPGYVGWSRAIAKLDITGRIGAITAPTLVVVGEEDQGTPVSAARAIHEQIKGSELVILENASHMAGLERPQPFNKAIGDFLDRQTG